MGQKKMADRDSHKDGVNTDAVFHLAMNHGNIMKMSHSVTVEYSEASA